MNLDVFNELFDKAPRKEHGTLLEEVFTKDSNGKKVSLADCTDEEFERFISPVFELKQRKGKWTPESRQAILDQLEYLLDWIVD